MDLHFAEKHTGKPLPFVAGLFLLAVLLLPPLQGVAQLRLQPLPATTAQLPAENIIRKNTLADTVFLQLPFFDDFSGEEGYPDSRRWSVTDSSALISLTYGINPPSKGVAAFDGATATGNPYDFRNTFRSGTADRLVSHYFDLERERPSDSVYLAFYWQAEGLGETPTPSDSLKLQFIDEEGIWQTVWATGGSATGQIPPFRQEKIAIEDPALLHAFSRFRFVNEGRLAGAFDSWQVDYVQFYRKRDLPNGFIDVAINQPATSLLKNYRSMPMRQFVANPAAEMADTVYSGIRNLSDTFNLFSPQLQIADAETDQRYATLRTGAIGQTTSFGGTNLINNLEQMRLAAINDLSFIDGSFDSLKLTGTFFFDSLRAERFAPTRRNDTIQFRTDLTDYYAYDDGSAEYAIGIYQRFGRVAYRFVLNEPAVLTAVDMQFPRISNDLSGQTFNLVIWQRIDTVDQQNDVLAHRQNVPFIYSEGVNTFRRIALSRQVLLSDTFYVGFEQLTEEPLTVGWDKNTNSGEQIFFNVSSVWRQNTQHQGSMLVRPVFGGINDPTALPATPGQQAEAIHIYPNPATGTIFLEGEMQAVQLADLSGRVVLQKSGLQQNSLQLQVGHLPRGLYLARIVAKGQVITQKVLLR